MLVFAFDLNAFAPSMVWMSTDAMNGNNARCLIRFSSNILHLMDVKLDNSWAIFGRWLVENLEADIIVGHRLGGLYVDLAFSLDTSGKLAYHGFGSRKS